MTARSESPPSADALEAAEDLAFAKHRLARAREIGARNPEHFQNVGLQHRHIVALLAALSTPGDANGQ